MTPIEASLKVRRIKERLLREVLIAESLTLEDAKREAIKLSSGSKTLRQLAKMGHPYARRRPRVANPEVINAQSGRFRSAWKTKRPRVKGNGTICTLSNNSKEAHFMRGGTSRMIARPIEQEIVKRVAPVRLRRLKNALRVALRG